LQAPIFLSVASYYISEWSPGVAHSPHTKEGAEDEKCKAEVSFR